MSIWTDVFPKLKFDEDIIKTYKWRTVHSKWYCISKNSYITPKFIRENIDNINFYALSMNKFEICNNLHKKEAYYMLEKRAMYNKLINLYMVKHYM